VRVGGYFLGIFNAVLPISRCLLNVHVSMYTRLSYLATADILPLYLRSKTANRVHQTAVWSWMMVLA